MTQLLTNAAWIQIQGLEIPSNPDEENLLPAISSAVKIMLGDGIQKPVETLSDAMLSIQDHLHGAGQESPTLKVALDILDEMWSALTAYRQSTEPKSRALLRKRLVELQLLDD
jgi:hypothetical protein